MSALDELAALDQWVCWRVETRDGKETKPPISPLHVVPTAPQELLRAAHRLLSLANHPDRGGRHDAQVAINRAWEELRAR